MYRRRQNSANTPPKLLNKMSLLMIFLAGLIHNPLTVDLDRVALAGTFYVSTSGSDSHPGTTSEKAWRTIQHAVDTVAEGDEIIVLPGTYSGARIEKSGAVAHRKTLRALQVGTVTLEGPGARNRHGSIVELETWEGDGTVAYWNVIGFEISGAARYGIDIRNSHHISIQSNRVHGSELTGIFTAFSDDVAITGNDSSYNGEHGIYHSNSGDRPTISHNVLHHNSASGLHMNGDLSMGGDGIISNGRIEANIIYENGTTGGSGINLDGVTDTLVINNLLYDNHASGISLYQIDGAKCSSNNKVIHNTVVMPSDGRWVVNMPDSGCSGNQLINNILYNAHNWRGSIVLGEPRPSGFVSDYNVLVNRLSTDGGDSLLSLSAWQALGYDLHSVVATPAQLFADAGAEDYHLSASSPALNAGVLRSEVAEDLDGIKRPQAATVDLGAYERQNYKVYYIRPDGGSSAECTGLVNAPYQGTGANQPCAWSHPFWALEGLYTNPSWRIKGGDTLIILPGSYRMGLGAPNTETCDPYAAFACVLPPLPSGPDPQHPTFILGAAWNDGCDNPPQLWGAERAAQILDLTGTANVQLRCLELTDHAGCVEFHANSSVRCERDQPPYGNWAGVGIYAADSSNVVLKDLDIHGLGSIGVHAGRLKDWSLTNVRIAGNGWAGWDGDIDGNDSNAGLLNFRNWTVEWNGCVETYPDQKADHCWAQSSGGYGDGVGTGASGGNWLIEDSTFRYNTSDGLDLLYIGRIPGEDSSIQIKRTRAYGNAGNQIKTNGPTWIENALIIGNCGYFNGQPFAQEMTDHCRAYGAAVAMNVAHGDQVALVNSTITGQGDCLATFGCDNEHSTCDGGESLILQNNIFRGHPDYFDPQDRSCYVWFDRNNFYTTFMDHNIIYGAKIGSSTLIGPNDIVADPLLVNDSLANFDGHLQRAESPAVDSGLPVGSAAGLIPDHDIENILRPQGLAVDRGAYEFLNGSPIGSLSVTISPEQAATAGGKWRVDEGAWRSSNELLQGLETGAHQVDFLKISGWTVPQSQNINIEKDKTTQAAGSYASSAMKKLLWSRRADGFVALWTLDASDNRTSYKTYGPYAGWAATSYHQNSDGTRRLLWTRKSDGLAALWTLDANDNPTSYKLFGPYKDWTATSYHQNADGTRRILWSHTSGLAALWTLNGSDNRTSCKYYGPYSGWEVTSYHQNSDGTRRLLWTRKSDGLAALWTLDANDNPTSYKFFGPYKDWTATSYRENAEGARRILWSHTTGLTALWTLNGSDNQTTYKYYGPHSGWSAESYD